MTITRKWLPFYNRWILSNKTQNISLQLADEENILERVKYIYFSLNISQKFKKKKKAFRTLESKNIL